MEEELAILQISVDPEKRSDWQSVELAGQVWRLRLHYNERTRSWYIDLHDDQEQPIITGQRISPGWNPLQDLAVDGRPDGIFYVNGPEPYDQLDFGTDLVLRFVATEDLPDVSGSSSGLTVSLA